MNWDIIVLTTMDDSQNIAFKIAFDEYRTKYPEYCRTEFRLYSDKKIGVKLGSGGAALYAVQYLYDEFGDSLYQKRILLIPVGGYSQRQPNCSALGKLFLPVPLSPDKATTLLHLKLSMYCRFLPDLPPGIFVAASDTLEYYGPPSVESHSDNCKEMFGKFGFTLFTYRSPIKSALNHGIFIFNKSCVEKFVPSNNHKAVVVSELDKVLQKPTMDELESENGVHSHNGLRFTFIDGTFFMAANVVRRLVQFTQSEDFVVDGEVCIYADFIRPLGKRNTADYAKSNIQRRLYDLFRTFSFQVLWLVDSYFYHIGSLKEMLYHFSSPSQFSSHFNLVPHSCLKIKCQLNQQVSGRIDGCVMSSLLTGDSLVPRNCLVEYCRFPMGLEIINNVNPVVMSNISVDQRTVIQHPMFVTTLPISVDSQTEYVTIIFDIDSNYKKTEQDGQSVIYFEIPITDAFKCWNFIDTADEPLQFADNQFSLWHAKLFPSFPTMSQSLSNTLEFLNSVKTNKRSKNADNRCCKDRLHTLTFHSMSDVLQLKDVRAILRFRSSLLSEIEAPPEF